MHFPNMMNESDLEYIVTHGARAYAEELQKKITDEIRQEILRRMKLSPGQLAELKPLTQQTIEGLVAVEIDARLSAYAEMGNGEKGSADPFLKALLLSQGHTGTFAAAATP